MVTLHASVLPRPARPSSASIFVSQPSARIGRATISLLASQTGPRNFLSPALWYSSVKLISPTNCHFLRGPIVDHQAPFLKQTPLKYNDFLFQLKVSVGPGTGPYVSVSPHDDICPMRSIFPRAHRVSVTEPASRSSSHCLPLNNTPIGIHTFSSLLAGE